MNEIFDEVKTTTYKPPMTNAQKIRAMTDEELADWIVTTGTICDCCIMQTACAEDIRYEECKNNVTNWLQQPVKEGADHE